MPPDVGRMAHFLMEKRAGGIVSRWNSGEDHLLANAARLLKNKYNL
jgi:hypothetical protein